jgi:lipopolysaccharide transport system permease protein
MSEIQIKSMPQNPTSGRSSATGAPAASNHHSDYELLLYPRSGWIAIDWKELWEYSELLWFLVWRDITVRYKQTVLGGAWAVIQPMLLMAIFSIIFGRFAKIDSMGFPYPVFVFASLVPWTMFSQGFPAAGLSLVSQQHLLTKVYFPRIYVPVAAACVFMVDLLISLGLYAIVLCYYQIAPNWTVVFLPALIVLTLIATLGFGLTLSAVTVLYRDFKHIVPFIVQIMMYVTPVIYPAELITRPLYRWLLSLNPMFGLVTAYRSCILGLPLDFISFGISSLTAVTLFLFGVYYFRRTERYFADLA